MHPCASELAVESHLVKLRAQVLDLQQQDCLNVSNDGEHLALRAGNSRRHQGSDREMPLSEVASLREGHEAHPSGGPPTVCFVSASLGRGRSYQHM